MVRISVFFLIVLGGVVVLSGFMSQDVNAETITVAKDGSGNYQKIQSAIDEANEGDTIRVFEGIFYEHVTVPISIDLIGNGSDVTTIDGSGWGGVVKIRANWVNMSGFTLTNGGSSVEGISLSGSDNSTISECLVNTGNIGISLRSSSNNSITNNTVNNKRIQLRNSDYNLIYQNIISNSQESIHVESSHYNHILNNTLINNSVSIFLYKANYNVISYNFDNKNGCEIRNSNNNFISNNSFHCNESNSGINLFTSDNSIITLNIVYCNDINSGIFLDTAINNTISYNEINATIGYKIQLSSSHKNIISNNSNILNKCRRIQIIESNSNIIADLEISSGNNSNIYLDRSSNNTISNSSLDGKGVQILGETQYHWFHSIYPDTTVNGRPIRYYKNEIGGIVPAGSAQVFLVNCSSIQIENQNCSNVYTGISVVYSTSINISRNICDSNIEDGIYLYRSRHCLITNNTCNSNKYSGISLSFSYSITLSNNTLVENSISIFGNSLTNWNTYTIDTANTVNGNIVYYYKNVTGITVPSGAGQVILANGTSMKVEGQDCSNGSVGILVGYSTNITLENNTCSSNNRYGISLWDSDSCTLSNNICQSNVDDGLCLENSDNNTLMNNICSSNSDNGISLMTSDINTLMNNTCSSNRRYGISLWFSSVCTLSNNTCQSNTEDGISLMTSDGNILMNSTCSSNVEDGISLMTSTDNSLMGNTCQSNTEDGISLMTSDGNALTNNTCSSNTDDGISLMTSDGNILTNNTCSTNIGDGIILETSNYCKITNNKCENNEYGIYLDFSNNCNITDNICKNNKYGIYLFQYSRYSKITKNTCTSNNNAGIYLFRSGDCLLSNNTCENNEYGIMLIDTSDSTVENNTISGNRVGIYLSSDSQDNAAHYNEIYGNSEYGIDVSENEGELIFATENWWGHPSGPYHRAENPSGIGNEVSDDVNFKPWLDQPFGYKIHHVALNGSDSVGNGDQGNPYRTIQKAIDIANEWDMIMVSDGVYFESISINKRNVTIIGDSSDSTILDAESTTTACTINANYVEIKYFTIRNATGNGILFDYSSGVKITDCTFTENSIDLNLSNSKDIQLINSTFQNVNINDDSSSISVLWPVDLKVADNRSGFIPDAHVKITDKFGTTVFNAYSDDSGRIPQLVLVDYEQNRTGKVDYNPYTISIWKDGYLNYEGFLTVDSYTRTTLQLEEHLLPGAVIIGEMIQYVDMDSPHLFDGSESTGRSITYFWEMGDGNTSTAPSPSHTFTVPGSYQVNLTVTDDYQNISTASIVVIVENVIPTAHADSDIPAVNEDDVIAFTAQDSWDTISDSLSFLWDFGDGTLSSDMTPSHAYSEQGQYDVSLRVADRYGGMSSTVLSVTVSNVDPRITLVDISGIDLPGKQLRFSVTAEDTAGDEPHLLYLWDFGDSNTASGNDVNHSYQKAGTYSVEVTVMDDDGASHSRLLQYNIKEPMIPAVASSHMVFQDETVSFNVSHELDDGSYSYTWYFGDGSVATGKDTVNKFTAVGVFTPIVVINDGRENLTIMLQDVVVNNVVPEPHINITITQVTEDEVINFDASDSTDSPSDLSKLTFTWDFGDGSTGVGMVVNHAYTDMETYSVVLTIWDGKDTNTTQVVIEVENPIPISNAGRPKEREGIVGTPVILDASASTDTPSDLPGLNYTWSIENDTVYGKTCSYVFASSGTYSVVLTVTDDDGATSSDTITFLVSDAEESEDEGMINGLNLILIVIMIVLIAVIGYLVFRIREDQMIRDYITKKEEEAIEVVTEEDHIIEEGKLDDEMFKPPENSEPAGNGSEETVGTESSAVKEKVDETDEVEKHENGERE